MENKRILTLAISFIFLFSPILSSAYEVSAHRNLHLNILKEYEKLSGVKISPEQKQAFLKGARDEDSHPRYLNHFLDPTDNN